MTSPDAPDTPQPPPSRGTPLANQIIDLANGGLEKGLSVEEVAEGLRHAAANFSAFAFFRSEELPKDPNKTVENFISLFEYYLGQHKPEEPEPQGLFQTIAQAKKDL